MAGERRFSTRASWNGQRRRGIGQPVAFFRQANRYVGWQALKAYPFTAVVGLADSEMLHPYEETRTIYTVIALA
jgi:hypothetical protein